MCFSNYVFVKLELSASVAALVMYIFITGSVAGLITVPTTACSRAA